MGSTNWVYIKSERGLWTVGFYAPDGEWHPETDCNSTEYAAERCNYLNGGKPSVHEQLVEALKSIKGGCYPLHIQKRIGKVSVAEWRDMAIVWLQETARVALKAAGEEI